MSWEGEGNLDAKHSHCLLVKTSGGFEPNVVVTFHLIWSPKLLNPFLEDHFQNLLTGDLFVAWEVHAKTTQPVNNSEGIIKRVELIESHKIQKDHIIAQRWDGQTSQQTSITLGRGLGQHTRLT